jgi:hypothetical protein
VKSSTPLGPHQVNGIYSFKRLEELREEDWKRKREAARKRNEEAAEREKQEQLRREEKRKQIREAEERTRLFKREKLRTGIEERLQSQGMDGPEAERWIQRTKGFKPESDDLTHRLESVVKDWRRTQEAIKKRRELEARVKESQGSLCPWLAGWCKEGKEMLWRPLLMLEQYEKDDGKIRQWLKDDVYGDRDALGIEEEDIEEEPQWPTQ